MFLTGRPPFLKRGYTCRDFEIVLGEGCGGVGGFGHIVDDFGRSAFDACCFCGGGSDAGGTSDAGEGLDRGYVAIAQAIGNAPTDGTLTTVSITQETVLFQSEIIIQSGQRILLVGAGGIKPTLDAQNKSRHFFVEIDASLSAENLIFEGGNATASGGAIYSNGGTVVSLLDCTFRYNYAWDGGAIAFSGKESSADEIRGCIFQNNTAGFAGGAIAVIGSAHLDSVRISDSMFIGNHASNSGGAILSQSMIAYLINCVFRYNRAREYYGGAVNFLGNQSSFEINGCTFDSNTANGGGALALKYTFLADARISHCSFTGNEATGGHAGAAFIGWITGQKLTIDACTFSSNAASKNGGAIRIYGSPKISSIIISNTQFDANVANKGGALNVFGTGTTIDLIANCTFINNMAKMRGNIVPNGAAIINYAIIKSIAHSTFQGNYFINGIEHGNGIDIYSGAQATTSIRDSQFLTPETNGKARVVGHILRCDHQTNLTLCPPPFEQCADGDPTKLKYGVTCGLACPLGQYGVAPGGCVRCPKGKYGAAISTRQDGACELCPAGRSNPYQGQAGLESCLKCAAGTHSTMGAPHCLRVCVRGQKQVSIDTCQDCAPGQTSTEDAVPKCAACEPGTYAPTKRSPFCRRCSAGRKSNAQRIGCDLCPAGTYSLDGSSACTPCGDGQSSGPGSGGCYSCIPGEAFAADGYTCVACAKGMERPHDKMACYMCPSGRIAPNASSAYCTPCEGGTYAANETACSVCPAGFFCARGVSTPEKCTDAFSYCPRGASQPLPVKGGFYTNLNRTSILECEPGHYCSNGVMTPCPQSTFGESKGLKAQTCSGRCLASVNERSDAGATSCSCLPTFINDTATNECVCGTGEYRVEKNDVPRCDKCPPGSVKAEVGNQKCDSCGTFQSQSDDRKHASQVPSKCFCSSLALSFL